MDAGEWGGVSCDALETPTHSPPAITKIKKSHFTLSPDRVKIINNAYFLKRGVHNARNDEG